MNNKTKGIILLLCALCFAFYAICQILVDSTSSRIKLNEPIQLEKGREYEFHYKHNIWDSFNNYEVSLVFDKNFKVAAPTWRSDSRNTTYKIQVILKNKDRALYDSAVDKYDHLNNSFSSKNVYYDIYRYNYNIYDPSEFTLIVKVLEIDPTLAGLNPHLLVVGSFVECGFEVLFWGTSIIIAFIFSILTFVFGVKFLIKKPHANST